LLLDLHSPVYPVADLVEQRAVQLRGPYRFLVRVK
jgi:hypothetical protein